MSKQRLTILICMALALLTLAAYWRVLGCEFVDYDDDLYVTANRWVKAGPALQSIAWAFTSGHASNWHPLTWISHMIDWRIYGPNALGHHLTNLILHALSTLLLFLLLRRMTGSTWRSAFVAALFAVHPLHVESVAWVAERKDVLSTLLWMLTLHAYVSYVRQSGWGRYVLTLGLFVLGIMAKPMLVTLPITLLLLDYWPLGRLAEKKSSNRVSAWKLVWEKAPFFAVTAASCAITYVAQRNDAVVSLERVSAPVRLCNAVVAYVAYLAKMVWPQNLAVIYPHPLDTIPVWQVIGSALLLVAVSVLVLRAGRTRPYLAFGWFWYIITLIPVIGLVQVGLQSMADRYTYVPLIGVFIALTWAIVGGMGERENGRKGASISPIRSFPLSPVLAVLAVVIITACTAGTWHQTGYWKDSVVLFQQAVDVTERNSVAEINLGRALVDRGRFREGIAHQEAALRIKPSAKANNNIGVALIGMGKPDEAIPYLEKAIDLNPNYARPHYNLGCVLFAKHRYGEAAEHLRDAVSREPDNADAHYHLAYSLAELGEIDEAAEHYRETLRLSPRHHLAHFNLGSILRDRGEYEDAAEEFRAVIRVKPDYAEAHHNLGGVLDSLHRIDEAMQEYREAIRLKPRLGEAHNNLAIDLYTSGRYAEAWKEVGLARKCGVDPHPGFIQALTAKGSGR